MSTLTVIDHRAQKIKVTPKDLIVYFFDGRRLEVPLSWFPKLAKASPRQRNKYQLIGNGVGIHWLDIDEDLSINGLLGLETD